MKKFYFISLILLFSSISAKIVKAEVSLEEVQKILNEHPEIIVEALQKYETKKREHNEEKMFHFLQNVLSEKNVEISDVEIDEEDNNYFENETFDIPQAIEIVKQYECPDNYGHRICGIVVNNRDKPTHVSIEVTYYDADDTQIDRTGDSISITDPFGKAQFQTTSCHEKFDHYKIEAKND